MRTSTIFGLFVFSLASAQFYNPLRDFHKRSHHGQRRNLQRAPGSKHWQRDFETRRQHVQREEDLLGKQNSRELMSVEIDSQQQPPSVKSVATTQELTLKQQKQLEEERLEAKWREAEQLQCQNWETQFTNYLSQLKKMKLKHQIATGDFYKIVVELPPEIARDDLDVIVQGPKVVVSARRDIPEGFEKPDFCEVSEELRVLQEEKLLWRQEIPQFDSPIDVSSVTAEIVMGHKLQIEFVNPPEHERVHIQILDKTESDVAAPKMLSQP